MTTVDLTARRLRPMWEARQFSSKDVEIRQSEGGSRLSLTGYASVTDSPYPMDDFYGSYQEIVRSGAFARSLAAKDDVYLLFDHAGQPLARTKSGTLRLSEDSTGLAVEAELDSRHTASNDVIVAMERGDLDVMSFAFQVTRQEWSPDCTQRDIQEVKLFDVSVVKNPANPATSAQLSQRMASVTKALREKRALDAEDVNMLTQALGWLSAIDNIVDEGQESLATYLQVPNPDADDAVDALRSLAARIQSRAAKSQASDNRSLYKALANDLDVPRKRTA